MTATPNNEAAGARTWNVLQIGARGCAYDPKDARRAFTYEHQPGNVVASQIGAATSKAANASAGDSIDLGLCLLKALEDAGFGVFQIGPPADTPAPSARDADGDVVAERHGLYGIRWIKQLRDMEPGTQWFIEGRSAPIATVLSSASVQWHMAESEIPHGTKYYTRPPASVPVAELVALAEKWSEKVRTELGYGPSGYALLRCANQLTALAQKGDARGQG